jgi:hypothetical protein
MADTSGVPALREFYVFPEGCSLPEYLVPVSVREEIALTGRIESGEWVKRESNSPTVSCPFYDNEVPINGACHSRGENCPHFRNLMSTFDLEGNGEVGRRSVVCSYNSEK